jgi:hypothetical protein
MNSLKRDKATVEVVREGIIIMEQQKMQLKMLCAVLELS